VAWIDYQSRIRYPVHIERDRPTPLTFPLYRDGALAAPSSGTITVYNAANIAVVSAAAVTITSSVATYTVLAASVSSESLGVGWRVEWSLVMGDTNTHVYRQDASLVRCRLAPVITDLDLTARHSDLNSFLPTGSTTWQNWIEAAWEDVIGRLEGMGRRPYLILSPEALRPIHLYRTLEVICRDLSGAGDAENRWTALAEHYSAETEAAWGRCSLVYDETDSGRADGQRRKAAVSTVWLGAVRR
jgi:hypothetical protein